MGENSYIVEEVLDGILLLFALIVSVCFFSSYGRKELELRYLGNRTDEFLEQTKASGNLTRQDYEAFMEQLARLNGRYELELTHTFFEEYPVYRCFSEEELMISDAENNVRLDKNLEPYQSCFTEVPEEKLQKESNATLFAKSTLPLPENASEPEVMEPLCPVQKVYEGESLITLCYVYGASGFYLVDAGDVRLTECGQTSIELKKEGIDAAATVEVMVYPRFLVCENGHSYANTGERIAYREQCGEMPDCPYCVRTAVSLRLLTPMLMTTVGIELSETGIAAEVTWLDGHKEIVTPESDGWQDDYDAFYCGLQTVKVSYQGCPPAYLTVTSEGEVCTLCGQCCTNRNYLDYLKFPVCNRCRSGIPRYTGTTSYAECSAGMSEILSELETEERYVMERGSLLLLVIKENGKTVFTKETVILGRTEK